GKGVEVTLLVYPGGREPWYLAYSGPLGGEPPYGWRMWVGQRSYLAGGFRDLKGQGFGLDRHRLRTGASLKGWLWLLVLGMALLVLLGTRLRGREWLPQLLAHPERQSLFRLGRIALAQGPPPWREAVLAELVRLLEELGGGK
ncbi:MAG: IS4-like element ISTth2 family transposase, partial [Thermus sp.]